MIGTTAAGRPNGGGDSRPKRSEHSPRELSEATSSLYETSCEVFDDPDSPKLWHNLHRDYLRTHAAFCRELEELRRSCGMVELSR